jgi:hypothetical protein
LLHCNLKVAQTGDCGYGRRIAGQSPHCRAQFRSTPIAKASPVHSTSNCIETLVSAQTGSGKTVAFGLAMAGELLAMTVRFRARQPLALVIAPTRELALQVSRELPGFTARPERASPPASAA